MMERMEEREERSEGLTTKFFDFTLLKMVVETEIMMSLLLRIS